MGFIRVDLTSDFGVAIVPSQPELCQSSDQILLRYALAEDLLKINSDRREQAFVDFSIGGKACAVAVTAKWL